MLEQTVRVLLSAMCMLVYVYVCQCMFACFESKNGKETTQTRAQTDDGLVSRKHSNFLKSDASTLVS